MAVLVIILATTSLGMAMTGTMAQGEERETDWTMNLFGSDPFIPVTGITGLPTTATPGVPLTLSGTVQPSNATNTDIVWSILNAGGTGATLTDNLLTVTSAGTVSLKATIFGGFEMVSAGDDHTAAIGRDGTLWTWGNNDSGELGLGIGNFGTSMYVPTKVGTDTDWAYVSAGGMYGYGYTMAIKTDGTLWGWGYNDYGQLGDGGTATKYLPTQIGSDTDWKTVSTGLFHTAAIKTDGTLWTWGYNASGQLGHGNMNEQEESPVQVGWDTDWEVVSAGGDHTVAIKGGDLWGWGYNSVGQLGDDPLMLHIAYARVLIDDNNTWIHVSAGNQHTVAVNDEGDLYTCGSNGSGQLGIGYGPHQSIMLEKVSLSGSVVNVSAGMFHTSVVLANGTLYSFGGNFNGELGIGSSGPNQWEPVQEYHGNSDWEYVSVGSSYTMAVKNDGTMWAWGNNLYGQLGDGTSSGKNVPTTVGAHFEVPFNITAGASGVPDYRYVITAGTSNTFTATGYNTDNSPYTVATNVAMQSAINAIQLDADGNDCSIFFANALNTVTTPYTGTGQLDIGSQNITFDDTSNAWGEITIDGKLISNLTSVALTGIIRMEGSVTINSFADITLISTPYDPNTNVIFHGSSGDLNIKGGELISDTYVIHTHVSATGNLNISGGLVKSISPFIPPPAPDSTDPAQPVAVLHESSGDLTISGSGKVQADDTVGIRRGISAGSIIISDGGTVSGYQAITFGTTTSSTQTLEILSGGKVESTYVAIYTSTGTVNVYDGAEIRAVGSGSVGIWNQNTATVNIYGGRVESNGNAVLNERTGTVNVYDGILHAIGNGNAAANTGSGSFNIYGGTISGESNRAVFNTSTGTVTISQTAGKTTIVTSANQFATSGTVHNNGAGTISITGGTVQNTHAGNAGNAVYNNAAGAINISGGTVQNTGSGSAIYINSTGTVTISQPAGNTTLVTSKAATILRAQPQNGTLDNGTIYLRDVGTSTSARLVITGGTVENTGSGGVICNESPGAVNISGGTVRNTGTGNVIWNASSGTISISQPAGNTTIVTSASTNSTQGTIYNAAGGAVNVSGGTVLNTVADGNARTIYNNAGGPVSISGGTVSAVSGATIYNNGTATVSISGDGWVENNSSSAVDRAIHNFGNGTIDISGGTVQSNRGHAILNSGFLSEVKISAGEVISNTGITIWNTLTGTVEISGGTVRKTSSTGDDRTIFNNHNGTISISGGTVTASASAIAIYNDGGASGMINISGGEVLSVTNYAVWNASTGTVSVTGGKIQSVATAAIQNASTGAVNIYGGTILSDPTGFAVYMGDSAAELKMGGDPAITGMIYVAPGKLSVVTSGADEFDPSFGRMYTVALHSYTGGAIAVKDGKGFEDNFKLPSTVTAFFIDTLGQDLVLFEALDPDYYYVISGSGTAFTVVGYANGLTTTYTVVGAPGATIQNAIDAIRADAGGVNCSITFIGTSGTNNDTLDIGTANITFVNGGGQTWGVITLKGKVTAEFGNNTSGAIVINGVSLVSEADITNTLANGRAVLLTNAGTITVTGGTITVTGTGSSTAIRNDSTGAINIKGGTVLTTSGGTAIWNNSTGAINISGGTITRTSGTGIYNASSGVITINENDGTTLLEGVSGSGAVIHLNGGVAGTSVLNISAGTIRNAGDVTVYNTSVGTINISGGNISSGSGSGTVASESSGNINITNGTISNTGTGRALWNRGTATITISGGAISSNTGLAIQNSNNSSVSNGYIVLDSNPTITGTIQTGAGKLSVAGTFAPVSKTYNIQILSPADLAVAVVGGTTFSNDFNLVSTAGYVIRDNGTELILRAAFTVTFDVNGGTPAAPPAQQVVTGETIPTAPSGTWTRTNFTTDGKWYTRTGSAGAYVYTEFKFGAAGTGTPVTAATTLYLTWISNAAGLNYIVTENSTSGFDAYKLVDGGSVYVATGVATAQSAIDAIKADAGGANCSIEFRGADLGGDSYGFLDIGAANITFTDLTGTDWGGITIYGKLTSAYAVAGRAVIETNGVTINSHADIASTGIGTSISAIRNFGGGSVNIINGVVSGVSATGYTIVNEFDGVINISGGTVRNTGGGIAILTYVPPTGSGEPVSNAGQINISGGLVESAGTAIKKPIGILNISGGTVRSTGSGDTITSLDGGGTTGTGSIYISGGIVENTGAGYAINHYSLGVVDISGGTVRNTGTGGAISIPYEDAGKVTISQPAGNTTLVTSATADAYNGTIYISYPGPGAPLEIKGGTVENTGAGCVINSLDSGSFEFTGTIDISGGTVRNTGTGMAIRTTAGTINVTGGTVSSVTGVAIRNDGTGTISISQPGATPTIITSVATGTSSGTIYNASSGSVNITGGTVQNTAANVEALTINNQSSGAVNISGGTVSANTGRAVFNQGTGTVTISQPAGNTTLVTSANPTEFGGTVFNRHGGTINMQGGTVENTSTGPAINNGLASSTITMTGGTVKNTGSGPAIYNEFATININGGIVENTGTGSAIINTSIGRTNINGATVRNNSSAATINNSATLYVYSGLVENTGTSGSAITNTTSFTAGTVSISGGTVRSNTGAAIFNDDGAVSITGGTVTGNVYAVYCNTAAGTVNLGGNPTITGTIYVTQNRLTALTTGTPFAPVSKTYTVQLAAYAHGNVVVVNGANVNSTSYLTSFQLHQPSGAGFAIIGVGNNLVLRAPDKIYEYIVYGSTSAFAAIGLLDDGSHYQIGGAGYTNTNVQNLIDLIRADADGNNCSIFFANALNTATTPYTGTGQLDIGSANITFDDTSNAWGEITLHGKLISDITSSSLTGIIHMEGSVTINSFADITLISTPDDPNTNVIFHGSSGDLNIKGGNLISDTYVIHTHVSATGNLNISGGLVKSISPFIPPPAPDSTDPVPPVAILHDSSGDLTVSGSGKVQADDTVGIRRGVSGGSIIISDGGTVSGYQAISFGASSVATLEILSGGKVESTYTAIHTSTGTVNVYDGAEIRAVGSGSVGIWNFGTATVNIYGGRVESNGNAVLNNFSGTVNVYDGILHASGNGNAAANTGSGSFNIYGGTISGESNRAVFNTSTGTVTISQTAGKTTIVTSANQFATSGTVHNNGAGTISITGGTVQNTHAGNAGNAVFNNAAGAINISGGTVQNTGSGSAIYINSTGTITISQPAGNTTLVTSKAATILRDQPQNGTLDNGTIYLRDVGTSTSARLVITGGIVENTGSGSVICNESPGAVSISGGTVRNTGSGDAIYNASSGTISISQPAGNTTIVTADNENTRVGTPSGTIYNAADGTIDISGGTVQNTHLGSVIHNNSVGAVNISGGTVHAIGPYQPAMPVSGVAIYNVSTGKISISGDTTLVTSNVLEASRGTIHILNSDPSTDVRLEITGGTVQNALGGNAIYNASAGAVDISGGIIQNTGVGNAIYNASTGAVNISGGTVSATSGIAIHNNAGGIVTISQPAGKTTLVTSTNAITTQGTIYNAAGGTIDIQGGTVQNTFGVAGSRTIYNNAGGTIDISGGNVSAINSGITIYNNAGGPVNISGGTVQNTGTGITIQNASTGAVNIYGGTILASAEYAVYMSNAAAELTLGGDPTITGMIYVAPGKLSVITSGADEFDPSFGKMYTVDLHSYFAGAVVVKDGAGFEDYFELPSTITEFSITTVGQDLVLLGQDPDYYYVISGSGTRFTAVGYANGLTTTYTVVDAPGIAIRSVINAIQADILARNGSEHDCTIIFGDGTTALDIGTEFITFDDRTDPWGVITLGGILTSSRNSDPTATVLLYGNVTVNSYADIEASSNGASAISNSSTGYLNILGGTVRSNTSIAINNQGTGTVTISEASSTNPTIVTSANTNNTQGTIRNAAGGTLDIQGGTVRNTGNGGNAIYNAAGGTINITGGTVRSAGSGAAIYNNGTGAVDISGGLIENTGVGNAIWNASTGAVNISGGTVQNTGTGSAITGGPNSTGVITISEASDTNPTLVTARGNDHTISLSTGGTVTAPRLVITGGTVENTGTSSAIYNNSPGAVSISGGTVQSDTGPAIRIISTSTLTISETSSTNPTFVTSNTTGSFGTIHVQGSGLLSITGGTIENTGSGSAIYRTSSGTTDISGGMVRSDIGTTILNNNTGTVNISGGTVENSSTGVAILNSSTGEINISGGTVKSDTGSAIRNNSTGVITISEASSTVPTLVTSGVAGNDGAIILANAGTATTPRLVITGGTVENTGTGNVIWNASTGAVDISGGTVENTGTGNAIRNQSTGAVSISGGTVRSNTGVAIWNNSTGVITISEASSTVPTLVTSANVSTTSGTIHNVAGGAINISGGTVSNPSTNGNARTIYNATDGTVNISGGTVSAASGITIYNNGSGAIDISGGTVLNNADSSSTIENRSIGTIDISGGTVENLGMGRAIFAQGTGLITISETSSTNPTLVKSRASSGVSTIQIPSGTGTAPRLVITGGTVECAGAGGSTISNGSAGAIDISGGTVVNTGSGRVIYSLSTGHVTISETSNPTIIRGNPGSYVIDISSGATTGPRLTITGGLIENTGTGNAIFNNGAGTVSISGGTVRSNTGAAIWNDSTGVITISEASSTNPTLVTSANVSATSGTIHNVVGGTINISGGTVSNPSANGNARTIYNAGSGIVNITGGTVSANGGVAIRNNSSGVIMISGGMVSANSPYSAIVNQFNGTIDISGGTVRNTGAAHALENVSTGAVNISGGTVQSGAGVAIWNSSLGVITISEASSTVPTIVTSANTNNTQGTIRNVAGGTINISGGTVSNTAANANARTIYNASSGIVNITGGTVTGDVYAVYCNAAAGAVNLGGNPTITGTIYVTQNRLTALTTGTPFAPVSKMYTVQLAAYAHGDVVVVNGANVNGTSYLNSFQLHQPSGAGFEIIEVGNNLVLRALDKTYEYIVYVSTSAFAAIGFMDDGSHYQIGGAGYTNTNVQNLIDLIRADAEGNACSIFFANALNTATTPYTGTGQLNIGSQNITFENSTALSENWGNITLGGSITANTTGSVATGVINISSGVNVTSTGAINNSNTQSNARAVQVNSGNLTVTGGVVSSTGVNGTIGTAGTGTVTVTGGAVTATTGRAIWHQSTGTVNITGGTVSATDTGMAIYNFGAGAVTISGSAIVSSGTGTTILTGSSGGPVTITGGTVSSTTGAAIVNQSTSATLTISGGTVSSGTGIAINNQVVGTIVISETTSTIPTRITSAHTNSAQGTIRHVGGVLTITGGIVENTAAGGNAIFNNGAGTVNISGGRVSATSGMAVYNNSTGAINVSGGTVSATVGVAIYNNSTGLITISETTSTIPTEVTSDNPAAAQGTIYLAGGTAGNNILTITGGKVQNNANNTNSRAIYNDNAGTITISGGTVSATTGRAINNHSTGMVNISGGNVSATTGYAIFNQMTGSININGGSVSATTGYAVYNNVAGGLVSLSGSPTITGTVLVNTGGLSTPATFTPTIPVEVRLGYGATPTSAWPVPPATAVLVVDGAINSNASHFTLHSSAATAIPGYIIGVSGDDLIVTSPIPDRYQVWDGTPATGTLIGTYYWLADAVAACDPTNTGNPWTIVALEDDLDMSDFAGTDPKGPIATSYKNAAVVIPAGKNITLTSDTGNQWTITQLSTNRHLTVNGSLTISNIILDGDDTDVTGGGVAVNNGGAFTMEDGAVITNCKNDTGGGVYISNFGGTFTMKGGAISGNTAISNGGGVANSGTGTITMTGGVISGNKVTYNGGGVYNVGTFTMEDGTISGNTATLGSGGGVLNSGTFTMKDGTISGNTATSSGGNGGGVFNASTFTMEDGTISGNAASIGGGVCSFMMGTFTMTGGTIGGENASDANTATDGGGVYIYVGGTFTMEDGTISGNTAAFGGGGVYIYVGGTFTMKDGTISGNTATQDGGGGVFNEGTFTMEDGTISGNTAASGGGVLNSGTFTMTGGTIGGDNASDANTATNGGGVYNEGLFTMEGGTIAGNTATIGGGVYNVDTFNMEDGTISGNTATSAGGGVYNEGPFTMEGGKISGNATNGVGGGVYNAGTFTMTGGTIGGENASDANTAARGGGVYNWGTFTMEDGKISGNTATSNGGGVYNAGTFTLEDGTISGNTATSNGGGVYYDGSSTVNSFIMEDGAISGNTATNGGGVYYDGSSIASGFILKGGVISDNTASQDGGGVYYDGSSGSFVIEAGTISDNTAVGGGGGVYYVSNSTAGKRLVIKGGEISGNTAEYGGGVCAINGEFEMSSDTIVPVIRGNTATLGGGVYVADASFFTLFNGEISGNTAIDDGGGVYVTNASRFEMYGGAIGVNGHANTAELGGGVYIASGCIFEMRNYNGEISYNEASFGGGVYNNGAFEMGDNCAVSNNRAASDGGGIYVGASGVFEKPGDGVINRNIANNGGGVYVAVGGTFTMEGGKVSGNTAVNNGGGVYSAGTFTMTGGTIGGENAPDANTATNGGGVYNDGSFTMNGGKIPGNKANANGGGVYVTIDGVLEMTGGVISDNTATQDGGGIYTEWRDSNDGGVTHNAYNNPLKFPSIAYGNIRIADGIVVSGGTAMVIGNTAGQSYTPPVNYALLSAITRINSQFDGALLTNDQINYINSGTTLTVSKTVTGKMGNPTMDWEFTVYFFSDQGDPSATPNPILPTPFAVGTEFGYVIYTGTTVDKTGTLRLDANGAATFYLKHGQHIVIAGVPLVGFIRVVETVDFLGVDANGNPMPIPYMVSFTDSEGTSVTVGNDTELHAITIDREFAFTNHWDAVVPPTGLSLGGQHFLGLIALALGAVASFTTWKSRRRADQAA